jgi:hypothetical protein
MGIPEVVATAAAAEVVEVVVDQQQVHKDLLEQQIQDLLG